MPDIGDLLKLGLSGCPLAILLFGPKLDPPSIDAHTRDLQEKRKQLRRALAKEGHEVILIEEEIKGSLPAPLDNAWVQELAILRSYESFDLIIILVHTPGTNVELGVISSTKELAERSQLFLCDQYQTGAAWVACQAAVLVGAVFTPYTYPADIVDCHLTAKVLEKVRAVQIGKFLF